MSSQAGGTPSSSSQSVSASAYLTSHQHQHPSAAQSHQYTQTELRQLVLEYLSSSAYADTARAFAREWTELDRDAAAEGGTSTEATNGNGTNGVRPKGNGTGGGDGMDGVEDTPPPSDYVGEAEGEGIEIRLVAASPQVDRNHKAVAFEGSHHNDMNGVDYADDDSDDEDDEDLAMLSKAELGAIRLRRSKRHLGPPPLLSNWTLTTTFRTTDIRNQILSGRIQPAIDLLNAHFPSVLAPSPHPPPIPPPTPNRTKRPFPPPPSACSPHALFLPSTQPPASDPTSLSDTSKFIGEAFEPEAVSLAPDMLLLNLHLQLFLELMRAAYAPSAPSTPSSSGILPPLSDGLSDGASAAGSSSSLVGGSVGALQAAVGQSQALSARVRGLPVGRVREVWNGICVNACGLMAYKDLGMCPVRGYLAQSRRETLAELVNAAILRECSLRIHLHLSRGLLTCCLVASIPQSTLVKRHSRYSLSRSSKPRPCGPRSQRTSSNSRLRHPAHPRRAAKPSQSKPG